VCLGLQGGDRETGYVHKISQDGDPDGTIIVSS